jgi:hypothetical protein
MEIADERERMAYVSMACGTDLPRRKEIEELLQAEVVLPL